MLEEVQFAVSIGDEFLCFDEEGKFLFLTNRSGFDDIINITWDSAIRKEAYEYFFWSKAVDAKSIQGEFVRQLGEFTDRYFTGIEK
jgi:hypothetical protein